ncbi:MAG: cytochrome bc complex cytochrome b subunit, partial [Sulfurimonadaceae bacterium]
PAHIYPEWYFLWSYEVLRGFFFDIAGISGKDLGLIAFGFAQIIFVLLPWLDKSPMVKPANQRPVFKYWFWTMMAILFVLTIFGKLPPTGVNAWIGFASSIAFIVLFLALPFLTKIEAKMAGGK